MLDCTISFSLCWTMVKMATYNQKCEQNRLKINNMGGGGVGINMSGVEKNRKINNRGDDYSGLESKERLSQSYKANISILNIIVFQSFTILDGNKYIQLSTIKFLLRKSNLWQTSVKVLCCFIFYPAELIKRDKFKLCNNKIIKIKTEVSWKSDNV